MANSASSGTGVGSSSGCELRIQILTDNFDAPNPDDSFRSLSEQVLEDVIVGGFGAIEVERHRRSAASAGDVAGGWSDDPHEDRLGWNAGIGALCAGHGKVWAGRKHSAERR